MDCGAVLEESPCNAWGPDKIGQFYFIFVYSVIAALIFCRLLANTIVLELAAVIPGLIRNPWVVQAIDSGSSPE
jgi:hypothetical protein